MATTTTAAMPDQQTPAGGQHGLRADRRAQQHHRDLQQHLGAEGDAAPPAPPGRPGSAHRRADQDGQHQRLQPVAPEHAASSTRYSTTTSVTPTQSSTPGTIAPGTRRLPGAHGRSSTRPWRVCAKGGRWR